MSIQKQKPLEGYKLDHATIKRISTDRLKSHIKKIHLKKNSYVCGCCCEFIFDIYSSSEEDRKKGEEEYLAVKRYLHFVVMELKSRSDYQEVIDKRALKTEKRKLKMENKGDQHLKKSKRKGRKS